MVKVLKLRALALDWSFWETWTVMFVILLHRAPLGWNGFHWCHPALGLEPWHYVAQAIHTENMAKLPPSAQLSTWLACRRPGSETASTCYCWKVWAWWCRPSGLGLAWASQSLADFIVHNKDRAPWPLKC